MALWNRTAWSSKVTFGPGSDLGLAQGQALGLAQIQALGWPKVRPWAGSRSGLGLAQGQALGWPRVRPWVFSWLLAVVFCCLFVVFFV